MPQTLSGERDGAQLLHLGPCDSGRIQLISVPFHDALVAAAGRSAADTVAPPDPDAPEAARIFAIAADLADHVRAARADGATPLVLAGDCNSGLGTVAGCAPEGGDLGVVWLDAHSDFDTTDTSASGSLDGVGCASSPASAGTRFEAWSRV